MPKIVDSDVEPRSGLFRKEFCAMHGKIDRHIEPQEEEEKKKEGGYQTAKEIALPNFHSFPLAIQRILKVDETPIRRWGKNAIEKARKGEVLISFSPK